MTNHKDILESENNPLNDLKFLGHDGDLYLVETLGNDGVYIITLEEGVSKGTLRPTESGYVLNSEHTSDFPDFAITKIITYLNSLLVTKKDETVENTKGDIHNTLSQ